MKAMTQRQMRVAELLRETIASILTRGLPHHPEITCAVTVSGVHASPDLRHATVYFSVLGNNANVEGVQQLLKMESRSIQQQLNRQLNLKFTPRLKFVYDDAFERAQRLDALLRDAAPKVDAA